MNLRSFQEPSTRSIAQAVSDPGTLRVLAVADDGIIEAIDDP